MIVDIFLPGYKPNTPPTSFPAIIPYGPPDKAPMMNPPAPAEIPIVPALLAASIPVSTSASEKVFLLTECSFYDVDNSLARVDIRNYLATTVIIICTLLEDHDLRSKQMTHI